MYSELFKFEKNLTKCLEDLKINAHKVPEYESLPQEEKDKFLMMIFIDVLMLGREMKTRNKNDLN